MRALILKVLNIEPEEATRVYLLLAQGFFMGIFLATYSVASTALFLSRFDEEKDLPIAILASGAIGILITYIYSLLQTRIRFKDLARIALLFVALAVIATFVGIEIVENNSMVVYAAFVLMIPFASIGSLVFWGIFGRIFDLRQSKRIIGGIDTGQLVASILALFGVGFIMNSGIIGSEGLYLFSGISAFLVFVVVYVITIKFSFTRQASGGADTRRFSFIKMANHKYIRLMATFVIISLIAAFFVDYSFLNVTSIQFQTEQELAGFIALFEATVVIFSFLFQTFVTDWVIANYGLRISLLVNPVLIGILTTVALLTGLTFGYSEGVDNFIIFFLIIAMSKLFIDSIKDALDGPAFKLYFLPIDPSIKFDVQTKIEGVVTAFAGVVAGALIIFINSVQLDLIYITIFLLPFVLYWFLNVNRMYREYRQTLQSNLAATRAKTSGEDSYAITQSLKSESGLSEADILSTLKVMEKVEPGVYEDSISNLKESLSQRVQDYARKKATRYEYDPRNDGEVKKLAERAAGQTESSDRLPITSDQLYHLGRSYKQPERLLAARLMRTYCSDENVFVLIELLRDIDPEVRMEAVITARKVKRPETWGMLAEMLDSTVYGHAAAAALVNMGQQALDFLENQFHRSGQSQATQLMIVQIMGKIGGRRANELLWKKIEFPDRKIVRQILYTFGEIQFQPDGVQSIKLNELVEAEIGKALWNLAARSEISDIAENNFIRAALQREVESNYQFIYMLLSLLYDPENVKLVRTNIESESADGIAYALELLDIFLDKDLKPKLFPLLEDIPVPEKLKRLQAYYPREAYEEQQTMNYILHRDYNSINRWTKACALEAISLQPDFRITKGIVAHLFNPDPLIRECAARILFNHQRGTYASISRRLSDEYKYNLDQLLQNQGPKSLHEDPFPFRFEKTQFLMSIPEFAPLLPVIISQLVDTIRVQRVSSGDMVQFDPKRKDQPIGIVVDGSLQLMEDDDPFLSVSSGDVFGNLFFMDESKQITKWHALEDTIVYLFDSNDFFIIVSNYPDLARDFVKKIAIKIENQLTQPNR